MPLHPFRGFDRGDASLLGVVISHPHQDHYGLAYRLPIRLFFSSAKLPDLFGGSRTIHLKWDYIRERAVLGDQKPIMLGPFTTVPFLVDHSAYDAYAIMVEADGTRLFYSGDRGGEFLHFCVGAIATRTCESRIGCSCPRLRQAGAYDLRPVALDR